MTNLHPLFAEIVEAHGLKPQPYAATRPTQFEAFSLGARTRLLDPLQAETLQQALGETTARWSWDRGDRFAVREIGEETDLLHIYAVRRKSQGVRVWNRFESSVEHERWAEQVCTVDLNAVAGIAPGLIGAEVQLHRRRQDLRPDGARMERGL